MALVNDNEVKKPGGDCVRFVPDDIEHRGVGRNVDAAIFGENLFSGVWPVRFVGQMFLESRTCLIPQGNAIDQKKNFFGMSASHQGADQGNTGAGFTCASGHNQQEVPLFLLNGFKYRSNGTNLIIASGN